MPKPRKPNSLIHGGFSKFNILPGEDPREFGQLLFDLHKEWAPDGPTEMDAVFTIATCVWRKARAQMFFELAWQVDRMDPSSKAYDEALVLAVYALTLETQPHRAFEPNVTRFLQKERLAYFCKKFPLESFSAAKWCQAVLNDIRTVLLPVLQSDSPDQLKLAELTRTAQTFTLDLLERELVPEERLDAMMNGAIKRLMQIKTAKQVFAEMWKDEPSVRLRATRNRDCAKSGKAIGKVHRLKAASLSVTRPEIGNPTMLPAAA